MIMDESRDKYDWKKVFKKILAPQTRIENEDTQQNDKEVFTSMGSFKDQEKNVAESSLISCSLVNTDSNNSECKFEFHNNLPRETDKNFESNLNFYKTEDFNMHHYSDQSSKKLPPKDFQVNSLEANGCKPKGKPNIPIKKPSQDENVDIPHIEGLLHMEQNDIIFHSKVPEWKTVFKNILSNKTSDLKVPHQKDNDPSKAFKVILSEKTPVKEIPHQKDISSNKTPFVTSDTPETPCQGRQYKPNRRYKNKEKYKEFEEREAEKKAKDIFARCRMFKYPQYNLNDFNGCGVDLFKKDVDPSSKYTYTYDSSKSSDKPYLPLTGCVAVSLLTPYTAADVAASYVPYEEDAWDDDLLI